VLRGDDFAEVHGLELAAAGRRGAGGGGQSTRSETRKSGEARAEKGATDARAIDATATRARADAPDGGDGADASEKDRRDRERAEDGRHEDVASRVCD
jgi:hypothetical protein